MMHLWEFCKLQRNYKEAKYTKYNFKVQSDFSVQFKRPVWLCKDLVNVSLLKFSWKFNLSNRNKREGEKIFFRLQQIEAS